MLILAEVQDAEMLMALKKPVLPSVMVDASRKTDLPISYRVMVRHPSFKIEYKIEREDCAVKYKSGAGKN